jgi:D-alanyl-lipoteichoic acid acyltransferase DltB (MBOAT superfamily)
MTFNSIQYAIFLPVVLALYWRLAHRQQNALLLAASYVFYGAWDPRFLGLMMFSTATDYTVGKLLGRTADPKHRKWIFLVSLAVNLGILATFKYFDFFASSAAVLLEGLGIHAHMPTLKVLLPVGISFYTFHGISYTFDVYRRDIEPATDLLSFACFISFFPQLVAGPIGRAHLQLPQFEHPRTRPNRELVRSAGMLILFGLFKKVVLADSMGPVADAAFATKNPGTLTVLFGAYAFAIQIYADFSGYTDVARGSARLFGIELIRNFEQPYLSRNITEFWQRWHISLSTWLRDYLYVPLGGNRNGRWKTYRNLLLTMVLGGLWHGAGAGFVLWGATHGALLAIHRWFTGGRATRREASPNVRLTDAPRVLLTFHVTTLAWIFFRSSGWSQATQMLGGLLRPHGAVLPVDSIVLVTAGLLTTFATELSQRSGGTFERVTRLPVTVRAAAYAVMIVAVIVWSGGTARPFIYFQF